jgi:uncharacterized phage infection (PIP) family protein YhgE
MPSTLSPAEVPAVDYLEYDYFEQRLGEVLALLRVLVQKGDEMSAELDRLAAVVQQNADAEQSAAALLGQLSELIRQNVTDPGALTKMADDLDAQRQTLAAAVLSNTPAAPTPAPAPAPTPAPPPQPQSAP